MHPLFIFVIVFAALCAIAVPLWFLAERKKAREKRRDEQLKQRDYLRVRVHCLRSDARLRDVQYVKDKCREHGLEYEDVGTKEDELETFRVNAHLNDARALLADLRRNNHEPLTCIPEIIEHLRQANRAYDWAAIGTTWIELRDAHHQGLIVRARARHRTMGRGSSCRTDTANDGQLEVLLILAHADIDDLYPSEAASTEKAS